MYIFKNHLFAIHYIQTVYSLIRFLVEDRCWSAHADEMQEDEPELLWPNDRKCLRIY